ncbi:MAG TPA: SH3 domain-containing protein [Candidatus Omnitrophota bacterium]|nr:SH3 domain-containing protein [Candidatus Omnitrophota bacterium]
MSKRKFVKIVIALAASFFWAATVCAEKLYTIAPTDLPNVSREMKTAGYWIGRIPGPDAVIMGPEAINAFNENIRENLGSVKDIRMIPDPTDGKALREKLKAIWNEYKNKNYFSQDDAPADEAFFDRLLGQMALESMSERIKPEYGFIVRYADQRILPTDESLYAVAGDIDFDELQSNALDAGTPVAVLHRSADQRWLYVLSESSDGWIKADKIALSHPADFDAYLTAPCVVTTSPKADLYLDEALTQFYDHVQMGAKLPLAATGAADAYAVTLPTADDSGKNQFKVAYVKKDQAAIGYLPYTPRVMIEQAFKMLNAPYGWGGMHGEQDCSRFLQQVFATVGINLPRNSRDQARVGRELAKFKEKESLSRKVDRLQKAPAGSTLLPMKGHILLYLGMVGNRPYAIHATWGYRVPSSEGDAVRVINRVAVTDLYLGEGSQKGSLLDRLNAILIVK